MKVYLIVMGKKLSQVLSFKALLCVLFLERISKREFENNRSDFEKFNYRALELCTEPICFEFEQIKSYRGNVHSGGT